MHETLEMDHDLRCKFCVIRRGARARHRTPFLGTEIALTVSNKSGGCLFGVIVLTVQNKVNAELLTKEDQDGIPRMDCGRRDCGLAYWTSDERWWLWHSH